MENFFQMNFTQTQLGAVSTLGLAHVGDGVFDLLCRAYLCAKGDLSVLYLLVVNVLVKGDQTVLKLHRDTVNLVKASTQAKFADVLKPLLTEEEYSYYRRGKNAHTHAAPKSASPQEYSKATGLEALFGALYLLGRTQRINELFTLLMEAQDGI